MANIKSAKKRIDVIDRQTMENKSYKTKIRTRQKPSQDIIARLISRADSSTHLSLSDNNLHFDQKRKKGKIIFQ